MWWSRSVSPRGGRRVALAVVAAAAVGVGGCGFRPVYGTDAPGDALGVTVAQPEGRDGYLYAARLRRRLGDAPDAILRVDTALTIRSEGLAITENDDVTRFNVIGDASFAVVRLSDGTVVHSGVARSVSAYNATASQFATRAAEEDARRRVAEDLAERVFARLASFRARQDAARSAGGA